MGEKKLVNKLTSKLNFEFNLFLKILYMYYFKRSHFAQWRTLMHSNQTSLIQFEDTNEQQAPCQIQFTNGKVYIFFH